VLFIVHQNKEAYIVVTDFVISLQMLDWC